MPPEVKTDRRAIIDAAVSIIEERGWQAVTARSIAARLGVSTQPIYRAFADMEEVRAAAVARGFEIFGEYVCGSALDRSVRYVMFAIERGRLFNFLFRDKKVVADDMDELAHRLVSEDIIDKLQQITELPRERVYRLHLFTWMALHGLAVMSADNSLKFDADEIGAFVKEMTAAFKAYFGG